MKIFLCVLVFFGGILWAMDDDLQAMDDDLEVSIQEEAEFHAIRDHDLRKEKLLYYHQEWCQLNVNLRKKSKI